MFNVFRRQNTAELINEWCVACRSVWWIIIVNWYVAHFFGHRRQSMRLYFLFSVTIYFFFFFVIYRECVCFCHSFTHSSVRWISFVIALCLLGFFYASLLIQTMYNRIEWKTNREKIVITKLKSTLPVTSVRYFLILLCCFIRSGNGAIIWLLSQWMSLRFLDVFVIIVVRNLVSMFNLYDGNLLFRALITDKCENFTFFYFLLL